MRFLTVCIEKIENGKIILPRIERVITATSSEQALSITQQQYPKYEVINVFDWEY